MSKKAEKFIEKYTTKDQNDWLVEKKDIIARFMESYHTEQLLKNDFNYKWSKLFASKRFHKEDGIITLTPLEQDELLNDAKSLVKKLALSGVVGQSEQLAEEKLCRMNQNFVCNCIDDSRCPNFRG